MSSVVTSEPNWGAAMQEMLASARLEAPPLPPPSTGSWSWPVFTVTVGDLILTEVATEYRGGVAYQLYAVDNGAVDGVLVGWFGLHVDALREINVWRGFVAGGGTLARWVERHPDGVQVTR